MVRKNDKYPERRTFYNPESQEVRDWLDTQLNLTSSLELAIRYMILTFGEGDLIRNYMLSQQLSPLVPHRGESSQQSNNGSNTTMQSSTTMPDSSDGQSQSFVEPMITEQNSSLVTPTPETSTNPVTPDDDSSLSALFGLGSEPGDASSRSSKGLEDVIREQQNNNK